MALSALRSSFNLTYQVSPIWLVDGAASKYPGKTMPIAVITEGFTLARGALHGNLSEGTGAFRPVNGTTLVQQDVATYNFLNLSTAANAIVRRPNVIRMEYTKTVTTKPGGGYIGRGLSFFSLKNMLDRHTELGGSYTIITSIMTYTGCLLTSLTDISSFSDQNKQIQYEWQFEFEQPLIQESDLSEKLNEYLSRLGTGLPV